MLYTLIYGFVCILSPTLSWDWRVAWLVLLADYIFSISYGVLRC